MALLATVAACLAILRFGNPQWSRYIFIFQRYFSPRHLSIMEPPKGYSGTWRTWWLNGLKCTETQYVDGLAEGRFTAWYSNGQKAREAWLEHDREEGPALYWAPSGRKKRERTFKNGEIHGMETEWDENGNVVAVNHYEAGKVVRTEDRESPGTKGP
jgi:hypothetical protein